MADDLNRETAAPKLTDRATDALLRLREADGDARSGRFQEALEVAEQMRLAEAFRNLGLFADRLRPYAATADENATLAALSAQSLVNQGLPFAARDVLNATPEPTEGSDAWLELKGLLGRTNKQIFVDAPDHDGSLAQEALDAAIAAYLAGYEHGQTWHGVNLASLGRRAQKWGRVLPDGLDPGEVALEVMKRLDGVPARKRDEWWRPTYAEAALAAGKSDTYAEQVRLLVTNTELPAFVLSSFLRQMVEIWDLDDAGASPDERALVGLLRGAILRRNEGTFRVSTEALRTQAAPPPQDTTERLEARFGPDAPVVFSWWRLAVDRARAVAAVCGPNLAGKLVRLGTGFLVGARNPAGGPPLHYVLTNAHLIGNPPEEGVGISRAEDARIRFEAGSEPDRLYRVRSVAWTSSMKRHDATLLELEDPPNVEPIPLIGTLPPPGPRTRLYIIGHSQGDELAISFEDNELLDHEGPPNGISGIEGVVRLHYRTPTEPGNSGSPAFVVEQWQAVALHRAGGESVKMLNGRVGRYEANIGISLASIAAAARSEAGIELII